MLNEIIQGDCLEVMKDIPDKSIDMILCDLPYGITACKWDVIIPFEPLWNQYKRIIKDNGAIVLTASQPFTSALVMSNPKMFKYEWIWEKSRPNGHLSAKHRPMRKHENILVFSTGSSNGWKNRITYNPQGVRDAHIEYRKCIQSKNYGDRLVKQKDTLSLRTQTNYPTSIQLFKNESGLHTTQKPVALFEYLIKTYTNEGDLVLDNCAGSGTTAIACINTNRNYILIEKDEKYFQIASERIRSKLI